jgi:anti-sigma factor RsiW
MSHADDGTLHAYLDGELAAAERTGLEAHLAGCAACRSRLEEERELVQRAQGLLARVAPPEVTVPLMREAGSGRSGPRPLPRWVPLAWAASVLVALGGGWLAHDQWSAQSGDAGVVALGDAPPARIEDSRGAADALARVTLGERDDASHREGAAGPAAGRQGQAKATAEEERRADAVVPTGIAPAAANEPARDAATLSARVGQAVVDGAPVGQALAPRTEAAQLAPTVVTANADERATLPAVTVDSARVILGVEPVTIPGLPVRRVALGGPGVVVVEQAIDARTVVRLYQRRAEAMREVGQDALTRQRAAAQQRPAEATERLARYVGPLRVEIAGPVAADSLSVLLGRVR